MDRLHSLLQQYRNAGDLLAESLRRNIAHEGRIDNETVLKLNAFVIAMNELEDFPLDAEPKTNETNKNFN